MREALRGKLSAAGLSCDEAVASRARLAAALAMRDRRVTTLVVLAADDSAEYAPLALAEGVPVLAWPARRDARGTPGRRLSAREREVLALVAAGTSNKGIARALGISPNTVKFHLTALFAKLRVATRAEAIAAAARTGELSL